MPEECLEGVCGEPALSGRCCCSECVVHGLVELIAIQAKAARRLQSPKGLGPTEHLASGLTVGVGVLTGF